MPPPASPLYDPLPPSRTPSLTPSLASLPPRVVAIAFLSLHHSAEPKPTRWTAVGTGAAASTSGLTFSPPRIHISAPCRHLTCRVLCFVPALIGC